MAYNSSLPELEIITAEELAERQQNQNFQRVIFKSPSRSPFQIINDNKSPIQNQSQNLARRLFHERKQYIEYPEDDQSIIDNEQLPDQMILEMAGTLELQTLESDIGQNIQIKQKQEKPVLMIEEQIKKNNKMQIEVEQNWNAKEKQTIYNLQNDVLKKQTKQTSSMQNDNIFKQYSLYKDFNCMLNLTDISYGQKGHNKFYQISIVHNKEDEFYVYTKWGRVGAKNPQSNLQRVESRYEAIKQYKKIFAKKTHNEWDDRENFKNQEGKYSLIQVDHTTADSTKVNQEVERVNKRNAVLIQKIKSNESLLPPQVKDLMALIWDINRMQKTLKELNFDPDKNPLGKLSGDQVMKGYRVLKEIQNELNSNRGRQQTLIDLSNQFYTNIPQNYGMRKLPMIDDKVILKQKIDLLDVLKELDIANKYLNIAYEDNQNKNPLDLFYQLLKCDIKQVEDENIIQLIRRTLKTSHGPTHTFKLELQKIFSIERKGENIRFLPFKKFHNKKLLWHGSRISNFVGILTEGLRIAPPDAPSSGYMFGKGIYFADIPSKSAQYCHHNLENPEGLLLLCEVALGDMYQVYEPKNLQKPPQYYHSIHAVGRNHCDQTKQIQFEENLKFDTGQVIPNESILESNTQTQLQYNEFVVYDVAQVRIRYIVQVKFNSLTNL